MMGESEAMYVEGQPVVIRTNYPCQFSSSQFQDIIDRSGIDSNAKDNTTNIIVTKLLSMRSVDTQESLEVESNVEDKVPSSLLNKSATSYSSSTERKTTSNISDGQFLNLVMVKKKKGGVIDERNGSGHLSKDSKATHGHTVALCSMCGKHFTSNYNLKRHMNTCKLCPEYEKGPRYECHCGRTYSQEWDLKKHKSSCQDNRKKCKNCLVPSCNLVFYHRSQLVSHMKKDHDMNIQDPEVLEFQSLKDFQVWKEREEEQSYTYYSKQTGSNATGVSINTYYICQHDGSDRTHGSTPRKTERRNKKGRVKTGRLCWAQMNVKEFPDGTVRVTYYPSHTHPITAADTEHHPLPHSISTEIKRRLADLKSDGEDAFYSDYPELKKSRKKSYGMNVRTLRALARKNRKLFRITAEAVDDDNGCKVVEVKDLEDQSLSPDKQMLLVPQDNVKEETHEIRSEILENCNAQWRQLNALMESGKLSDNLMAKVQNTLSTLLESCEEELLESENNAPPALNELVEVVCKDDPISSDAFPLSEEPEANLDLKPMDVYQVVTFGAKEPSSPPGEELLYSNAVELVAPREFIIIANEHAQILHTVNPSHIGLS